MALIGRRRRKVIPETLLPEDNDIFCGTGPFPTVAAVFRQKVHVLEFLGNIHLLPVRRTGNPGFLLFTGIRVRFLDILWGA
jgi:hypothetical protein